MVSSSVSDLDFSLFEGLGLSGSLDDKRAALNSLVQPYQGGSVYGYGSSYHLLTGHFTTGKHYLDKTRDALRASAMTSYGVGGARSNHGVFSALASGLAPGLSAPVAGAVFPGTSSRKGLLVVDYEINDVAHAKVGLVDPITGASGDMYKAGIQGCYRALLAILSSETRLEETAATKVGTWANNSTGHSSGGTNTYTQTPNDHISWSVTPPQTGPLAGKVFLGIYQFDPATLPNSNVSVTVDGGGAFTWTKTEWEVYGGANTAYTVIPVTLPIDGAAHTVDFKHIGSSPQVFNPDVLLVPSATPNNIAVMQTPIPVANGGGFSAGDITNWKANFAILDPLIQQVVAEFPNAIWVPNHVSSNGLWSGDGIHPNDRGNSQRATDLLYSLQNTILANSIRDTPNSNFAVV